MKNVLVLCTGNSCRSQMAEGYLRKFAADAAEIYSAGVEIHGLNLTAIKVMMEDGIDISKHSSNNIEEYNDIDFDYIITVCDSAKERCPYFPSSAQRFHHNFPDPAKARGTDAEIINAFRSVRNMVKAYCQEFAKQHLY